MSDHVTGSGAGVLTQSLTENEVSYKAREIEKVTQGCEETFSHAETIVIYARQAVPGRAAA